MSWIRPQPRSGVSVWNISCGNRPHRSQGANISAWPSRGRSCSIPRSCLLTNRSRRWTPGSRSRSSNFSASWRERTRSRCCARFTSLSLLSRISSASWKSKAGRLSQTGRHSLPPRLLPASFRALPSDAYPAGAGGIWGVVLSTFPEVVVPESDSRRTRAADAGHGLRRRPDRARDWLPGKPVDRGPPARRASDLRSVYPAARHTRPDFGDSLRHRSGHRSPGRE